MTDLTKIREHVQLFDSMGQATGLDLQEEAISGHLQFDEIAHAVMRCTRCSAPGACKAWLDAEQKAQTDGPPADPTPTAPMLPAPRTPPSYCRNADLFDYLKLTD